MENSAAVPFSIFRSGIRPLLSSEWPAQKPLGRCGCNSLILRDRNSRISTAQNQMILALFRLRAEDEAGTNRELRVGIHPKLKPLGFCRVILRLICGSRALSSRRPRNWYSSYERLVDDETIKTYAPVGARSRSPEWFGGLIVPARRNARSGKRGNCSTTTLAGKVASI
jgi:hypothetical protein